MTHYVTITPRDPLVARDGRPFGLGQGNRMRSLDWLYPSVVAGSLRTLLGKGTDPTFRPETREALKELCIEGPLPVVDNTLFLPRPLDCIVSRRNGNHESFGVRPASLGAQEGCNLPAGLRPALLPDHVQEEFKPAKPPGLWSCEKMVEWLLNATGSGFQLSSGEDIVGDGFIELPPKDLRVHVKMDPSTGAGEKEDALFMTTGLDFARRGESMPVRLCARVAGGNGFAAILQSLNTLHPLGGERRLARWESSSNDSGLWRCPEPMTKAWADGAGIRMVLATPAIFSAGWKPGWLAQGEHSLEGSPPGTGVRLRLVAAVVNRWLPLSGWSLEPPVGPKAIRRMVPAGSVYFFLVAGGDPRDLAETWLKSVCDHEQDRRDGFGLALWGTWSEHDKREDPAHG